MDKMWYRNPSKAEVIGRCGGDEKNRMTTQNRQKPNAKKHIKKQQPKNNNTCDETLNLVSATLTLLETIFVKYRTLFQNVVLDIYTVNLRHYNCSHH